MSDRRPADLSLFIDMLWTYEMLVFDRLPADTRSTSCIDVSYVNTEAARLGEDVAKLWQAIKEAAGDEAE